MLTKLVQILFLPQSEVRRKVMELFCSTFYTSNYYPARKSDNTTRLFYRYLITGWKQGHNPNPLFLTRFYLWKYPDVKRSRYEPLTHYVLFGEKEGRLPNPFFWPDYYRDTYPDTKNFSGSLLKHFLTYGMPEQRDPSPLFDTSFYVKQNPDFDEETKRSALVHFLHYGIHELRSPHQIMKSIRYRLYN